MTRSRFVHEDDVSQVELLPASVEDWCRSELRAIEAFSEEHREMVPGQGFVVYTGIYVRKPPPESIESMGISVADLRARLDPLLEPYDEVTTGYSTHREPWPGALAWGDDDFALFAAKTEAGIVADLWLSSYVAESRAEPAARALRALPRADEMLLVDWERGGLVHLADEAALLEYLRG